MVLKDCVSWLVSSAVVAGEQSNQIWQSCSGELGLTTLNCGSKLQPYSFADTGLDALASVAVLNADVQITK